jgi:hypothetical protein
MHASLVSICWQERERSGRAKLMPVLRVAHAGHVVRRCRYVDWSGGTPRDLVAELSDLAGDAARALQAGLAELLPA